MCSTVPQGVVGGGGGGGAWLRARKRVSRVTPASPRGICTYERGGRTTRARARPIPSRVLYVRFHVVADRSPSVRPIRGPRLFLALAATHHHRSVK